MYFLCNTLGYFAFVVWILSPRKTGMMSKLRQCLTLATLAKQLLQEQLAQVCDVLFIDLFVRLLCTQCSFV